MNPKKIMNDSLNMINKSRNKFLNKSFQQNHSGSSGRQVATINTSGDNDGSNSAIKLSDTINKQLNLKNMSIQKVQQQ